MGNFTKQPETCLAEALTKRAVALHVGQGVPVLDRDLNLIGDLITEQTRVALVSSFGDGFVGDGFAIRLEPPGAFQPMNDFVITAGVCLLGGTLFRNPQDINYVDQASRHGASFSVPPLTPIPNPGPDTHVERLDLVYLDGWLEEVTDTAPLGEGDAALANGQDVGVRTSVRTRVNWVVRVVDDLQTDDVEVPYDVLVAAIPVQDPTHSYVPLAILKRMLDTFGEPREQLFVTQDARRTRAAFADIARRARAIEDALRPTITRLSPDSGAPGTTVAIVGRNLGLGVLAETYDNVPLHLQRTLPRKSFTVLGDTGRDRVRIEITTETGSTRADFLVPTTDLSDPSKGKLIEVKGVSALDIGALGRSIWIIGKKEIAGGREISRWNGKSFEPIDGPGVPAERIAVGPGETAWVVTTDGGILRYEAGSWERMPGRAGDIGVGVDGSVFKVGLETVINLQWGVAPSGGAVARWTGRGWETINGAGTRIAVGHDGDPWVVDRYGLIYGRKLQRWIDRTGSPAWTGPSADIGVGLDGRPYAAAVRTDPDPQHDPPGAKQWVPNAPSPLPPALATNGGQWFDTMVTKIEVASIAVDGDGQPWIVTASGGVQYGTGKCPRRVVA